MNCQMNPNSAIPTPQYAVNQILQHISLSKKGRVLDVDIRNGEFQGGFTNIIGVTCDETWDLSRYNEVLFGNFLEMKLSNDFDAVIGNPPFTKGDDRYYWARFAIKACQLVKIGGFVGFVLPDSWKSVTIKDVHVVRALADYMNSEGGVISIYTNVKFEGVIKRSDLIVWQKGYTGSTTIDDNQTIENYEVRKTRIVVDNHNLINSLGGDTPLKVAPACQRGSERVLRAKSRIMFNDRGAYVVEKYYDNWRQQPKVNGQTVNEKVYMPDGNYLHKFSQVVHNDMTKKQMKLVLRFLNSPVFPLVVKSLLGALTDKGGGFGWINKRWVFQYITIEGIIKGEWKQYV